MKSKRIVGMFVAASVLVSLGACSKNEESGKIEDESVKETVVSDPSEKNKKEQKMEEVKSLEINFKAADEKHTHSTWIFQ